MYPLERPPTTLDSSIFMVTEATKLINLVGKKMKQKVMTCSENEVGLTRAEFYQSLWNSNVLPHDMICLGYNATYSQYQLVTDHSGITVRLFPLKS